MNDAIAEATTDEGFMEQALALAVQAADIGDVPVGAVVVMDGEVIGRGHNRREVDKDPLAHAELLALREASASLDRWRLTGATLYVTLEPCFMCAGALVNARVDRVVYGTEDPKAGAVVSLATVCTDPRLNHAVDVEGGVLRDRCSDQLKEFFRALRASS